MKQRLVSSQPGSEEPRPFSILTSAAYALSSPVAEISKEIDKTIIPNVDLFI